MSSKRRLKGPGDEGHVLAFLGIFDPSSRIGTGSGSSSSCGSGFEIGIEINIDIDIGIGFE